MIDDLVRDLRYAARMLRRSPALSAAVVLSLALGIGANTAIFSVIDVLMLRALPVKEPERLAMLSMTRQYFTTNYALFEKFRDGAASVVDLSAIIHTDRYNVPISAPGGGAAGFAIDSGPVRLALVSGNYFSMLGVGMIVGQSFTKDDDRELVISDSYWNRRFARAPDVLGRTLTMSGHTYEIAGVAPRDFSGEWVGRPTDVWMPIAMQPQVMVEIQLPVLRIDTIDEQLSDVLVQERLIALLSSFFGSLALLLACIGLYGVISYAVARRTAEISVRLALGATRARVLRTILQESLTLVVAGMIVGVPVALALTRLVGARLFGVSPNDPFTIAGVVTLMTLVAALASFIPAQRAARVDPMVALRCD